MLLRKITPLKFKSNSITIKKKNRECVAQESGANDCSCREPE